MVESSHFPEGGCPVMPDRFDDIERQIEILSATVAKSDAVDQKFAGVEQKFASVDQRFDRVDQRFDSVDQRFDSVDHRFDGLSRKIDVLHEATQGDIRLLAELIGSTNERMDRGFAELRADLRERTAFLQTVLQTQNSAIGELKQTDADHERRIVVLETDS